MLAIIVGRLLSFTFISTAQSTFITTTTQKTTFYTTFDVQKQLAIAQRI